jgi:hypothetical protein
MVLLSLWDGETYRADLQAVLNSDPQVFEDMVTLLLYLHERNHQLEDLVSEQDMKGVIDTWGLSLSKSR